MSISLSPKFDFCRDPKRAGNHQDLMAHPSFQEAAKAALLEYQVRLVNGPAETAIVAAHRLKGAEDFLKVLLNLGEPDAPRMVPESGALTPV